MRTKKRSVLFVCVYNACRSRISEALCRRLAPPGWRIESAGVTPSSASDPKARAVLRRHGQSMVRRRPRGLRHAQGVRWDRVVDISRLGVRPRVPARRFSVWDVPDPMDGPMGRYEGLYSDLESRVRRLVRSLGSEAR